MAEPVTEIENVARDRHQLRTLAVAITTTSAVLIQAAWGSTSSPIVVAISLRELRSESADTCSKNAERTT